MELDIKEKVESLVKEVNTDIQITSREDFDSAGERLKDVRRKIKILEEMRMTKTRPLDQLKKDWMDFFKPPIQKLGQIDIYLTISMKAFLKEEEDKKRREEQRLRELAEKEAQRLAKLAEKAEEKGLVKKAEGLKAQAEEAKDYTNAVIVSEPIKAKGISTRIYWKARVIDESIIPRQFLCVDEKKLKQFATMTKGTEKVEGVEFYSEEDFAVSTVEPKPEFMGEGKFMGIFPVSPINSPNPIKTYKLVD